MRCTWLDFLTGSSLAAVPDALAAPFLVMGCAYYIRNVFQQHIRVGNVTTHMSLVPLSEGRCVDLDDGTLDEGVGANQLVVGSIVHLRPATT